MQRRGWLASAVVVSLFVGAPGQSRCEEPAPPAQAPAEDAAATAGGTSAASDDYELYKVFVDTLDQVQRNYVRDISRRELIESAIQGVLSRLEDPYSSYISPQDLGEFRTSVESRFGGIGIQIEIDSKQLKVLSPLIDTPAYRAGLSAGDRIVEIEGATTEGLSIEEAVTKLKGEPGSQVTIGVLHGQAADMARHTLTREVIDVATVLGDRRKADDHWDYLLDAQRKIGYIRVTSFSRDTAGDLRDALDELAAQGVRGLVLDLRFNPGGLLSSAIEVSDLFVADGRIVSTEGRNSVARSWEAERDGTFEGFAMAVLVNRFSASASEIVAACLQDHDRAVVIGERTWGKGSVQNVIELEGGKSALKLTTASYQRPSGKKIHRFPDDDEDDEWGVTPNDGYLVRLEPDEVRALLDDRRQRDILRRHLELPAAEQASAEGAIAPAAVAPGETAPAEGATGAATAGENATTATEAVEPTVDEPATGDQPAVEPATDEPSADRPATDDQPAVAAPAGDVPTAAVLAATRVDRQLQKALAYLEAELAK